MKTATVFIEDLIARPKVELERILTFIGVPFSRDFLDQAIPKMLESILKTFGGQWNLSAPGIIPSTSWCQGALSPDYLRIPVNLVEIGRFAISQEMASSSDLTKYVAPYEAIPHSQL